MTVQSKPSRSFQSARRAQQRDLLKAYKAITKGSGWSSNTGVIFSQKDGWFAAVAETTHIVNAKTEARLVVKPLMIDPIFWDLVGEPQLRRTPLSFRYFGALTCRPLIVEEVEIDEEGGSMAIAERILAFGEERLSDIAKSWTITDFLQKIGTGPNTSWHFATIVTTLIADDRREEALALCEDAIAKHQAGGFFTRQGGFPEAAARWIKATAANG